LDVPTTATGTKDEDTTCLQGFAAKVPLYDRDTVGGCRFAFLLKLEEEPLEHDDFTEAQLTARRVDSVGSPASDNGVLGPLPIIGG